MYLSAQNKEEIMKKAPLGKREKVCMEQCRKGTVLITRIVIISTHGHVKKGLNW
jgi:hypothetical protein